MSLIQNDAAVVDSSSSIVRLSSVGGRRVTARAVSEIDANRLNQIPSIYRVLRSEGLELAVKLKLRSLAWLLIAGCPTPPRSCEAP